MVKRENGDNSYEKYYNERNYIHIIATEAVDWTDADGRPPRRGGVPYLQDWWPVHQPTTTTITSAIDNETVFGYSQNDGFYVGHKRIHSYTKQYVVTNPSLDFSLGTEPNLCMWKYQYSDYLPSTNNAQTGYLFEKTNWPSGMNPTDFNLRYDVMLKVAKKGFLGIGWVHSSDLKHTFDIYWFEF